MSDTGLDSDVAIDSSGDSRLVVALSHPDLVFALSVTGGYDEC